jgi:hypothetical protein
MMKSGCFSSGSALLQVLGALSGGVQEGWTRAGFVSACVTLTPLFAKQLSVVMTIARSIV